MRPWTAQAGFGHTTRETSTTTVLPAPEAVRSSLVGESEVHVTWTRGTPGATGHDIYRVTPAGGRTLVATTDGTATGHTFTDPAAEAASHYEVQARTEHQQSAPAGTSDDFLTTPRGVALLPLNDYEVLVIWDVVHPNTDEVVVYAASGDGAAEFEQVADPAAGFIIFRAQPGLGQTHTLSVGARNHGSGDDGVIVYSTPAEEAGDADLELIGLFDHFEHLVLAGALNGGDHVSYDGDGTYSLGINGSGSRTFTISGLPEHDLLAISGVSQITGPGTLTLSTGGGSREIRVETSGSVPHEILVPHQGNAADITLSYEPDDPDGFNGVQFNYLLVQTLDTRLVSFLDDEPELNLSSFNELEVVLNPALSEAAGHDDFGLPSQDLLDRALRWFSGQMTDAGKLAGDLGWSVMLAPLQAISGQLGIIGTLLDAYGDYEDLMAGLGNAEADIQEYLSSHGIYNGVITLSEQMVPGDDPHKAYLAWVIDRSTNTFYGVIHGDIPTHVNAEGGFKGPDDPIEFSDVQFDTVSPSSPIVIIGDIEVDENGKIEDIIIR